MPMRVYLIFLPGIFVFSRSCNNLNFFFALFQMLSGQLRKKCYRAMSGMIFSLEFSSNFRYNYASFCNVAVRFECRKKVLNCSTAVQNLLKYFLKELIAFFYSPDEFPRDKLPQVFISHSIFFPGNFH